jgi:Family of unknown function (DUF5681)
MSILMNQQVNKGPHRWRPGETGNPKGRPIASRQKIAESLLAEFRDALDSGDPDALKRLKADDPGAFYKIAAGLLPRETSLKVEQAIPGGLDPEAWRLVLNIIDLIRQQRPEGVDETQVFEFIGHSLRAEFAKPVAMAIPPPPVPLPSQKK